MTQQLILSIYSREMETYVHIKTHMRMFIAALFVKPQTGNYPNIPQRGNGYIYTIEYYSAIKPNKTLINTMTWMNTWGIILNEKSQPQKLQTN